MKFRHLLTSLILSLALYVLLYVSISANTGTAIWRSGTSTTPLYSNWNGSAFIDTLNTASVGNLRIMAGAEAPTRNEKVIVGVDNNRDVSGMIWDGASWSNFSFNPLSTVSEAFWWGFDVVYESQSGDAVNVFNNGSTGTQGISTNVWDGTVWTKDTITTPLSGEPQHMHMASNPNKDEAALIISNSSSRDYALIWDGSSWGNSIILDGGSGDNLTDIYVAYEQQSGEALSVYGKGSDKVYFRKWKGSAWGAEDSLAKPADASGNIKWTTLASDPNSNRIVLGALTGNQDIWICMWDGSAWDSPFTLTNSNPGTIFPNVAVAFESVSGDALVVAGESSEVLYIRWENGIGWTGKGSVFTPNTSNSMMLDSDPTSDHIMLGVQDGASELYYVLWDSTSWGMPYLISNNTGDDKNQPFIFLWDIYSPRVYYVSPSGNDNNNGLDTANAWASIDRGEQLAILMPGDTVNILSGQYDPTNVYQLKTAGSDGSPIIYRKADTGTVLIDGSLSSAHVFEVIANHVVIEGLEIRNGTKDGIRFTSDSCIVRSCYIHDINDWGINSVGIGNLFVRNIIAYTGKAGIEVDDESNHAYHNTVFYPNDHGIHYKAGVIEGRVFNNIIVGSSEGIRGKETVIAGFNDLWLNSQDYTNGISDSAGGISADPLFVDTASGDFSLQAGSPCIDSALDIGYPFFGSAPDMGAIEFVPHVSTNYYVSTTGNDSLSGLDTANAWASIDNGDKMGLLAGGDTVNILTGTYPITSTVTLITSGTDSLPVVYRKYGDGEVIIDMGGVNDEIIQIDGDNVHLIGLKLQNSARHGIQINGDSCRVENCFVHFCDLQGFDIYGSKNTILRNIACSGGESGLVIRAGGEDNHLYGNTIHLCPLDGIWIDPAVSSARVFNNIITSCGDGIEGPASAVYAYNNVWNNSGPDYISGAYDSAGGISADPLFVDTASGDFTLQAGSPCIDSALDLGYPFHGSAPDMGAIESLGDYIQIELFDGTPFGDTTLTTDNDTTEVYCRMYDSADSLLGDVSVNWSIIGVDNIGKLSPIGGTSTTIELDKIGTGQIVAVTGSKYADTSGVISCIAGQLATLTIIPDSANISIGDSIQFSVSGIDADSNSTDIGTITWKEIGRSGDINSSGLFIADKPGLAKVIATSSIGAMTDTTGFIDVEELYLTTISLGDRAIRPAQNNNSILAFRIENYFDIDKAVEGLTIYDISTGAGSSTELLSNVDSLYLYYDKNNDSLLTVADSLVASIEYNLDSLDLSFSPLVINPDSGKTFLTAVKSSLYPYDGDSLDILLVSSEITTSDSTVVAGPDSVNSLGFGIFDGITAEQIAQIVTGTTDIQPTDSLWHLMTVDIPRNGYLSDTLKIFSILNSGSANQTDFDSLILYQDDGDNNWGGASNENRIGILSFTGEQWSRSGLSVTLDSLTNRFYIVGVVAAYPSNGVTIAFNIPINGLEMSSGNDGPIDSATTPIDTITILVSEAIAISSATLSAGILIPGIVSGPLLALELTNSYAASIGLDSLMVAVNMIDSSGATQMQLDSQLDSLLIYINRDNDFENISANDSLIAVGIVSDGLARFSINDLAIGASGGELELFVTAAMNADNCKNDNQLILQINDAVDIYMSQPVTFEGEFPLVGSITPSIIENFPASNIILNEIEGSNIFGGQNDNPVLGFVLPGNGYAVDSLFSLRVTNSGSLINATSIISLNLWSDLTGDGFSVDDIKLGPFTVVGNGWEIGNLNSLINSSGAAFIVTVDVASLQFEAGTIRLGLPIDGVLYTSGTDGPDDVSVENTQTHLIFPSNRITAISVPAVSSIIMPGISNHNILTFALYNGYQGQSQFLNGINLDNISQTVSNPAYADYELGQVTLYFDDDDNRVFDNDSLIAIGHFSNGLLQLSGLDIELPAESLSYFYVCSDFPTAMIDSDSLALSISGPSDFQFSASVSINGDLPIVTGGYFIVDGSISRQYEIIEPTPQTLNPGDTSILMFAFKPAYNGDLSDTLNSLTIENIGDADSSDISSLELWLDSNNDSLWQDSDSLLGQFIYDNGGWTIETINLKVDSLRSALLLIGDISASASPDVYFRGSIPINGCLYLSENDGPKDSALISDGVFVVSSSHLQVAGPPINQYYSVGQSIAVNITVTNVDSSPIDDVTAAISFISDSSLVILDSSVNGPVSLNAGAATDFSFYYTSLSPGSIYWRSFAFSALSADTSLEIQTATATIQTAPVNVAVQLINSIPTSVTRGQANVFPFGIRISHPDTSTSSASLRLDSLTLNIEDGYDNALFADEVFSRIVLTSEYNNLTVIETVPHLSQINMSFSHPVIIHPNEEKYFSLLVDIDSLALASHFVFSLNDISAIPIVDNNNGQAVSIDPSASFPLKTASCRIDDASQQMVISTENMLNNKVNYGQNDVDVLKLRLRHPGMSGSSPVQLTGLSTLFVNENSDTLDVSELLSQIRICRGPVVVGEATMFASGTEQTEIELNSPLTLNDGEIDSLIIQVSVKETSPYNRFGLLISDSLSFVVRDLSSGSLLEMATDDSLTLAAGSEFPISSNVTTFDLPALGPQICIASTLPPTVIGGLDSLNLLEFSIDYDVVGNYASLKLNEILLTLFDSLGAPLDPDRLFDRIGYRLNNGTLNYQTYIELQSGAVVFRIDSGGLKINPGDSLLISLVADIELDVPFDNFALAATNLQIQDNNDSNWLPGFTFENGCSAEFPFITDIAEIILPAGRPVMKVLSLPVQLAYPGQLGPVLMYAELDYLSANPQGDLAFGGMYGQVYQRDKNGTSKIKGSLIFDYVNLLFDNILVASDSTFSGDTLILIPSTAYSLINGSAIDVSLNCDIRNDAPQGNYFIRFDDSTFMHLADAHLATEIAPILTNNSYPLKTIEISLTAPSLENSYSNYPNPFYPARGEGTTIGYILNEDAYVDIEIFTITGELVKRLVANIYKTSGSHDEDKWYGQTKSGQTVVPGTYYGRITARYGTGRTESFKRKISVLR